MKKKITVKRRGKVDDAGFYISRAEQIIDIALEVERGQTTLRDALRDAAMCGACEERDRILKIVGLSSDSYSQITSQSLLEVLGYAASNPTARRPS